MFLGYIPSTGKIPHDSVLKKEYTDVIPEGDYVGVLHPDYIQLDFDDEETSAIVMQIVEDRKLRCNILKTKRGVHLYFLNDGVKSQSVGVFNTIGLHCDVGLGIKNRVIPLRVTRNDETTRKVNGVDKTIVTSYVEEREWLQVYDDVEVIPPFLKPLSKKDFGLATTRERNQTLYEYILYLQFYGYSKEEVRQIIKVTNQYVLYEPMSDREVDTITRDDAFTEELFYNERGSFLHNRFGDYLLANNNVVKIDNLMHIYMDGIYTMDVEAFEKVMVDKIPSLKDNQRKEVYKYMTLKVMREVELSSPKLIGLKSQILDIETMQTFDYHPKYVISNTIPFDYKSDAYSEIVDKTLDKLACGDKQIRSLFEEMVGYSLYRKNLMQQCFILTGEGSNGKSTALNMLKRLLGKGNYSSLDMRELEDTFKPAELHGKLANIGDDISAKYMDNSSVFKKVVTGESFVVQRKYAQPFELESYATQIFCANELPRVQDKSDGFSRRINIIPFNAKFSKSDPDFDPFIEDKLLSDTAMEYLLKLGIEGLSRLLINRQFTKSDKGEKEKDDYKVLNNSVLDWIYNGEPKILNESNTDVYLQYKLYCSENGEVAMKKGNMTSVIKRELGFDTKVQRIDGQSVRVFVKE